MSEKNLHSEKRDVDKMTPYRFLMDPGVHSLEELKQFREDFPDCSSALLVHTFARIVYEKHGVRILGF